MSHFHVAFSLDHLRACVCGVSIRGNWRIVRRNLNNQRVIAVVSTDHNLINSDEDGVSTSRIMMCCLVFAIIVISLSLVSLSLSLSTHPQHAYVHNMSYEVDPGF